MTQGLAVHMQSYEIRLSVLLANEVVTRQTQLNPSSLSSFLPESVLSKWHNYALRSVVQKKKPCTFKWEKTDIMHAEFNHTRDQKQI